MIAICVAKRLRVYVGILGIAALLAPLAGCKEAGCSSHDIKAADEFMNEIGSAITGRKNQEHPVEPKVMGFKNKADFEDPSKFDSLLEEYRLGKGSLVIVSRGNRVRIIDTCPKGVRVEIMEGDSRGESGWFKKGTLELVRARFDPPMPKYSLTDPPLVNDRPNHKDAP